MNFGNQSCVNCLGIEIVEDTTNAILVCTTCGVVNDMNLQYTTYTEESESYIDPLYDKCSHLKFNAKTVLQNRLKSSMQMSFKYRNQHRVFEEIAEMCQMFPDNVILESKHLYKLINERKLYRGKNRRGMIGCCIFHACKIAGVHRTIKEISEITNIPSTFITKCDKLFRKIMRDVVNNTALNAFDIVRRFCSQLGLQKTEMNRVVIYIQKILKKDLYIFNGKQASTIVVTLIVHSSTHLNIEMCKKKTSKIFDVSIVTINKLLRDMYEYEGI
jgi:transcription initiation factor TFIIIB Brf1 subunit/transcription initiation factor TFIIB